MPLREYIHRVKGYQLQVKTRRIEMQRAYYPMYACLHAALGGKSRPMTPEQYFPTGEVEKVGPTKDPNRLINKALERINKMNRKA